MDAMSANAWFNPATFTPPATSPKGIFTTFIEGEGAVRNYLVPAGNMAILIDMNATKMYFKSTDVNGVPAPIRSFNIKEIPQPVAQNPNVVTREEFDAVNQKLDALLQALKTQTQGAETK